MMQVVEAERSSSSSRESQRILESSATYIKYKANSSEYYIVKSTVHKQRGDCVCVYVCVCVRVRGVNQ